MEPGQTIHISDDSAMAGQFGDLFVIDSPKFAAKLRKGDKITLNYGTVELIVTGFISKKDYLKRIESKNEEEKTIYESKLDARKRLSLLKSSSEEQN